MFLIISNKEEQMKRWNMIHKVKLLYDDGKL